MARRASLIRTVVLGVFALPSVAKDHSNEAENLATSGDAAQERFGAAADRAAAAAERKLLRHSDSEDVDEEASSPSPSPSHSHHHHDDDDEDAAKEADEEEAEDVEEEATTLTRTKTSTTATTTSITETTTTETSTTKTSTTKTFTTSTSTTSTSTTGPHVFGGNITEDAFAGWLSIWRSKYNDGLWHAGVQDPWESLLPKALHKYKPLVVESEGGVASGIVTEGMGYGIMIEGFLAVKGKDTRALNYSLSLIKSWQGLVNGGVAKGKITQPFAGGENKSGSSTKVDVWPYGISAVEWSHKKLGPSGVPAWKFPINEKTILDNQGSATDGDQDAVLGMIYTAQALDYPDDFVDMVMRAVISFASADIGFPDLYRVLPGGEKIFVPKLGSMWGGLLPEHGRFKTKQQPWCFSPGYVAPAHYRTMRNFALQHWKKEFNDYLPKHLDGKASSLQELVEALDSAVTAGYNILYYSSCMSGSVSNWVGVKAECKNDEDLNCMGTPWAHTPWVGADGGKCAQSGTDFGSFGADASRSAWRIAMDYVLYREESSQVVMYNRDGYPDPDLTFGAQKFLNRIVVQYASQSKCDGGLPGDCFRNTSSPYRMAYAYDIGKKFNATGVSCDNVPNQPESWWAGFMAYPTFAAFVAPYDEIGAEQMSNWMDTFSSICNFTTVNKWDYTLGHKPVGSICLTSYFEASQAVISTMIMADSLRPIFHPIEAPASESGDSSDSADTLVADEVMKADARTSVRGSLGLMGNEERRPTQILLTMSVGCFAAAFIAFAIGRRHRDTRSNYAALDQTSSCLRGAGLSESLQDSAVILGPARDVVANP